MLLHYLYTWLISCVFPITCSGCGAWDTQLCQRCQQRAFTPGTFQLPDTTVWYLGYYHNTVLRASIVDFKYHGMYGLSTVFGQCLAKILQQQQYDWIIPTPMHLKRLRERGYNQTELMAKQLHIPLLPVLQKTRPTTPQAQLNRTKRLSNVVNTLSYNKKLASRLFGRKVLLIDDVYTTGSTMAASRALLYQLGCSRVDGAVIAWDKL